jgi:hypothetical protein
MSTPILPPRPVTTEERIPLGRLADISVHWSCRSGTYAISGQDLEQVLVGLADLCHAAAETNAARCGPIARFYALGAVLDDFGARLIAGDASEAAVSAVIVMIGVDA